jgi:hypothetical protein
MRQRATRLFSIGGVSRRALAPIPILDQLGITAAGAYSLRRVRLAASLACRVRRSSDNAEANFGFTASGDLDAAALLAFVGTGDGFVTTWYDQSGNGRNAVQTTAGGQPQIVSNGVIQTQNGRATVAQSLGNQSLPISATFTGLTSATGVFVFRQLTGNAGAHDFRAQAGGVSNHSPFSDGNAYDSFFSASRQAFSNYGPASSPSTTTLTTHAVRQTGTVLQVFKNGVQIDGDKTVSFQAPDGRSLFNPGFTGTVSSPEGFVFGPDLSTTALKILERDQGAYYGISFLALDQLSAPAAAAYSLRKLRNAYVGNAIRVRRSSDNAELDIGFAASDDLDTASLLAFVGAGNGFVTTWYDQSGNARNATQTDPTKQPRIVSNGVMNMINGRAALSFDGDDLMQRTNIGTVFSTSAGFEFQTVVDLVSRSTNGYTSLPITVMNGPAVRVVDGFLMHSPIPSASHGFGYSPGNTGDGNAWPTFTAYDVSPVNAPPAIIGYNATSSTAALFQNGVQTAVSGSRTFAQTDITLTIGSRTDGFTSFPGNMSELIGFGGTLSTTARQTLERNQGAYYGIAVA